MGSQRGLLAIVAGLVALLVLSVGVILLRGDRPTASFPPDSPQAALQAYVTAWDADDHAAAWRAFSARIRATSTEATYREWVATMDAKGGPPDASRRIFFDEVRITGDTARITVTQEVTAVDGIQVNRYRTTSTVAMVREDGAWKIDQGLMGLEPWPFPTE